MSTGPEFDLVEQPFVTQLVSMGWRHVTGNLEQPSATGRERFRDVLMLDDLRQALHRINHNNSGKPWLDEDRITQAVSALERLGVSKLHEANQKATELLLKGTVVDGVEGWDQGRGRTVHYIDWERPENNTFIVVNQFKLECPAGQADKHIIPDVVLFVNGIPLVVIEAKSPYLSTPLEDAIVQLRRYANRRKDEGLLHVDEGNEELFRYAQFLVATCGERARVGTFTSQAVHYLAWKDTSPTPMVEVASALGKDAAALTEQEKLIAGMLRPAHLLDIVRHFTLFQEAGGRSVKSVCRYQQFRAVQLAVRRMLTGKTRRQDGEHDRRGGIVWHTQGSGKSLTMVFLIRKMRSDPKLRRFKVVVVTDRRDLERQLADTAALTGEVLTRVKSEVRGGLTLSAREVLQETLRRHGRDLVFAMIQKYRGELVGDDEDDSEDDDGDDTPATPARASGRSAPLPELNNDEDILVLVDEAHRSHTNTAHANLMNALPNCVKIGFTGTPIIMRAKGQTTRIFGEFIDRYTIRESEADGATVPILYEGRTTEAAVEDGREIDKLFEDMFRERTREEMEALRRKYATKGHVMEAERLIAAKARDMLRHYVDNIMPNGFKAQVVAFSRRAAIRYYDAFLAAQRELVAELEARPELGGLGSATIAALDPAEGYLARAHRFLPTIKALEFAPVISSEHNDAVDPTGEWSNRSNVDARIARFKLPLFAKGANTFDGDKASPLAFLIVKSMLLTGFDAPIEQVLYLDRRIKEAELLQAVARVNRTYARENVEEGVKTVVEKRVGIVVDYFGVARHLTEALEAYAQEDIEGAKQSLMEDEIPKLRDRQLRAVEVFKSRGLDIADGDACVELLRDEKIRAEFQVKLKQFLATLDLVLPRPEGLPYVDDAKTLAHIQARARNRYRDELLIGQEVGEKVRRLIDEHIISLGIKPTIPPIEITATDFEEHVNGERSPRAKASEMEHALRYHIRKHFQEDPTHYEKLSERLQGILKEFADRWDEMVTALKGLVEAAREGRQQDDSTGLDPHTQAPFFDVIKQAAVGKAKLEGEQLTKLCALTVELVEHVQQEIALVGFWTRTQAQGGLRNWIFQTLDAANVVPFKKLDGLVDKLMELAKANRDRLTGQ